jgi:hypothetical protein
MIAPPCLFLPRLVARRIRHGQQARRQCHAKWYFICRACGKIRLCSVNWKGSGKRLVCAGTTRGRRAPGPRNSCTRSSSSVSLPRGLLDLEFSRSPAHPSSSSAAWPPAMLHTLTVADTHTQRSQSRQHPLAGPQVLFLLMWQSGIHSPGRCRCNGGLIGTGRRELH